MIIKCNRPGGYNFGGISLKFGENEIDQDVWAKATGKVHKAWLDDIMKNLVFVEQSAQKPKPKPQPAAQPESEDPTPTQPLKSTNLGATDAANVIRGLTTVEAIEEYIEGDDRKTVTDAADKQIERIEG